MDSVYVEGRLVQWCPSIKRDGFCDLIW
jgi:hypothetical protein